MSMVKRSSINSSLLVIEYFFKFAFILLVNRINHTFGYCFSEKFDESFFSV